jgi:hypothetical protein
MAAEIFGKLLTSINGHLTPEAKSAILRHIGVPAGKSTTISMRENSLFWPELAAQGKFTMNNPEKLVFEKHLPEVLPLIEAYVATMK